MSLRDHIPAFGFGASDGGEICVWGERLRAGAAAATDLLWTVTSLRTWEDLVLQRAWTAAQYEQRIHQLLVRSLTTG
jgi:hypothetical protein